MSFLELDNGMVSISVNHLGAQLSSLRDRHGREFLWQGGDEWKGQAPVLFPVVGRMPGDELVHDGRAYPIRQHGVARTQEFTARQVGDHEARFSLEDNEETRKAFPFAFRLELRFTLDRNAVVVSHTVQNTGPTRFSASIGAHPGFAWPLLPGLQREAHTLTFPHDESAPIRRIADGLLLAEPLPTPVAGKVLTLKDSLFAADAIIFDELQSRSVHYSAPGAPTITVSFADFPLLGVWSRPPGEFVCIEPWFGMTAPQGFEGEYDTKPGQFSLGAGEARVFTYSITVETP
ncbi:MAG: aldose epimerase [Microbacteriaceae bacterium]|nr:aldose epimerase [Microbacteriaceae bacterium]